VRWRDLVRGQVRHHEQRRDGESGDRHHDPEHDQVRRERRGRQPDGQYADQPGEVDRPGPGVVAAGPEESADHAAESDRCLDVPGRTGVSRALRDAGHAEVGDADA